MKTKHTEGTIEAVEWRCHAPTTLRIETADFRVVIAECSGGGNDTNLDIANAARLALAWNCHDELVEALVFLLGDDFDQDGAIDQEVMIASYNDRQDREEYLTARLKKARAILAKATPTA